MAQYEMNLRDYWLIIQRRKLVIIGTALLTTAISWFVAQQRVPVYQATAAVKFEQSTSVSGLMVEVLSYPGADSIETQASLIKSYPILEDVARRLGRLPDGGGTGPVTRESKAYTGVLDELAGKLRTSRVPNTSILEITATSTSPREARDLANTVAEAYRVYNRSARNARITEARKFIEGQLKDVEGRVKRAEEEMYSFRQTHRVISPGAESTVLVSLFTQVRGEIEKTRQQRTELELMQGRLAKNGALSPTDRVYVDTQNPALQRLQATHTELILERNNLALEVTDKHPRLRALDDRLREVRAEMRRELGAQVALLRNREDILNRQMTELLQRNQEVPAIEMNLQRLQRDAKVNDDLLALLKTKHQEALIKESEGVDEVTLIRPATEPTAPAGAETLNTAIVGLMLGVILGLALAFVQETLDTSIGTIEDVESYLEVPVLGNVPHIDARETLHRLIERRPALAQMDREALQSHALLITHFDPKSPVAEAYRSLRTKVQFAALERNGKVIVVTSPTLQEGKTTTIVNLALTMAQNGQRTLLVGANLRRPSIHRFFGIEREPGLSDILIGKTAWRDCIRTVADILMGRFEMEDIMATPGLDNLHIIEAGPIPANPSELLSTPAMSQFLQAVREEYDIVLIDTPPVLPVTDSAIVASQADGVILVYQAGKVGRLVLKRAKIHLESGRGKVWGVVLNDLQPETAASYSHYYTHYYGEETPDDAPRGRLDRLIDSIRAAVGGAVRRWLPGKSADPPAGDGDDTGHGASPPAGGTGRRSIGVGILIVAGLTGTLVAAGVWRFQWLGDDVKPPELLRRRLDALPSAPLGRQAVELATAAAEEPAARSTIVTVPEPAGIHAMAPAERLRPTAPSGPAWIMADSVEASGRTTPVESVPPRTAMTATPGSGRSPAAPSRARFALEFGPFMSAAEAERVERLLTQAGYQMVRFRQQTGGSLYSILLEVAARDTAGLPAALREAGFPDAEAIPGTEPPTLRIGEPMALRPAVQLAERLRLDGYPVRIAAAPGEAVAHVIRHGNFTAREDAEAKGAELRRLGMAYEIVRIR